MRSRPLERGAEAEVAEAVFQQAFIPRKLDEVVHYERDRDRLAAGDSSEGIYYQVVTGMNHDLSGVGQTPLALQQQQQEQEQQQQQQQVAAIRSSADRNRAAAAAAAIPLPPMAAASSQDHCGKENSSLQGDSCSGSGASSSAAPSVAAPTVAAAGAKLKRNGGKGPSFLAFLPKAEDQLPVDSSSSCHAEKQATAAHSKASSRQDICPGTGTASAADGSNTFVSETDCTGGLQHQSATAADNVIIGDKGDNHGSSCSSDINSDSDSDDQGTSSSCGEIGIVGRGGDGDDGNPATTNSPVGQLQDRKAARKEHKKAVKEANREKRKTKVPKHVKKQHKAKAKKRN
jgi:hypothetical protein